MNRQQTAYKRSVSSAERTTAAQQRFNILLSVFVLRRGEDSSSSMSFSIAAAVDCSVLLSSMSSECSEPDSESISLSPDTESAKFEGTRTENPAFQWKPPLRSRIGSLPRANHDAALGMRTAASESVRIKSCAVIPRRPMRPSVSSQA